MMGREIRRVPKGWDHPRDERRPDQYKPLFDGSYSAVAQEWVNACLQWQNGLHPDQDNTQDRPKFYWEWAGSPPQPEDYRPDWEASGITADWVCLYENVSEGTPITPSFATDAELIRYLVKKGDFWGNRWTQRSAESIVRSGYAPSGIAYAGGPLLAPHEQEG